MISGTELLKSTSPFFLGDLTLSLYLNVEVEIPELKLRFA